MQLSDELTGSLKDALEEQIETENQKALRELVHGRKYGYTIPIHVANMRIINPKTKKDSIQTTVVPPLNIFIDSDGVKGDKLSRDAVEYRITYNNAAYPISHVYGQSGFLCLGDIFVPSLISVYSPQQPLETLFLANDRNKNHGNPQIPLNNKQKQQLDAYMNSLTNKIIAYDKKDNDWIGNDTLWRIGHEVLTKNSRQNAYKIMNEIFSIVFMKDTDEEV